jgi:DNA-binding NarL/FixJ family response regulator
MKLSPRELETLATLADGKTAKEAAHVLEITEQTVRNVLSEAYRKLEVHSLVGAYHVLGWISIPYDYKRREKIERFSQL